MKAQFVRGVSLDTLLNPEAEVWRNVSSKTLTMQGTPSSLQPTMAVRAAFPEGSIGAIKSVNVGVLHNGSDVAFLLEWKDPSVETGESGQDDTGFPDAAAILFAAVRGAPLMTMGAPKMPVNAWYWRADEDGRGRHITSQGIGTTETADVEQVKGRGIYRGDTWRVVIARPLRVKSVAPVAQLIPGGKIDVSFAVWEGGHKERAGIKAFALGQRDGGWHELTIASIA